MPKQRLTDIFVRNVKPPKKGQITYFDRELVLRVGHGGTKTWRALFYVDGKPRYEGLGFYDPNSNDPKSLTLAEARKRAIDITANSKKGQLPRGKEGKKDDRVESVITEYMKREGGKGRTAKEKQRVFDVYVIPAWGKKLITDIRRRDVHDLLDRIEDGGFKGKRGKKTKGGSAMADHALAHISRLFNWFAAKDERFRSPVVRGMKRTKAKERARQRILTDDEIKVIWPLLEDAGMFGQVVKELFLNAQRRGDVAGMLRSEIDKDGNWTIPAERYKTKRPHLVPLSAAALAVIETQPQIDESDFIFSLSGDGGFNGFSKGKRTLDTAILEAMKKQAKDAGEDPAKVKPIPRWVIHDIRRTAKTLMSRAGVRPDISERVLGHVIAGVEGTYDRYGYQAEKKDALEKLAAMIDRIVNPTSKANVVELKRRRKQAD